MFIFIDSHFPVPQAGRFFDGYITFHLTIHGEMIHEKFNICIWDDFWL